MNALQQIAQKCVDSLGLKIKVTRNNDLSDEFGSEVLDFGKVYITVYVKQLRSIYTATYTVGFDNITPGNNDEPENIEYIEIGDYTDFPTAFGVVVQRLAYQAANRVMLNESEQEF
jgi:hypothetical protein